MTPEQQHFWDILSMDPKKLCHRFGREMQHIHNKKQLHKRVDECFYFIMSNFDHESLIRTAKTWFCVYKLPVELKKLKSFDKFHTDYGASIFQKSIKHNAILAF